VVGQWDERDDWDGHIACDKNHQAKAAANGQAVAGTAGGLEIARALDSTL